MLVPGTENQGYRLAGIARQGRKESGDLIQEDVPLPEPKAGEILAVLATGAYNYSMAMNYNRVPRAPVVGLSGGVDRLWIKRESYDDLIKNDI